jgi:hypothetical protein
MATIGITQEGYENFAIVRLFTLPLHAQSTIGSAKLPYSEL